MKKLELEIYVLRKSINSLNGLLNKTMKRISDLESGCELNARKIKLMGGLE